MFIYVVGRMEKGSEIGEEVVVEEFTVFFWF